MASMAERENREIEATNTSGHTPVVFIHGLWLPPSSWADSFEQAGYASRTLDWPDDPERVEQARANPDVLAKKTLKQVADHTTEIITALDSKPTVMGHSTGGLLAQMLAGRGLSAATVAIDPEVFRGVLPLPTSVLRGVNTTNPGRGPLLIIDGEKDHTVPWAIANAAYKRQRRNPAVTDPEPGPLPHDRPRLARGRPDGARLRQAVRLVQIDRA